MIIIKTITNIIIIPIIYISNNLIKIFYLNKYYIYTMSN